MLCFFGKNRTGTILPLPLRTGSKGVQSLSVVQWLSVNRGSSGQCDCVWLGVMIMLVIINRALFSLSNKKEGPK